MKKLLALLLLLPTLALAEARPMWVSGGILCDTQADLESYITLIHLNGGDFPPDYEGTCGQFAPEQPIPMLVSPLGWYQTPSTRVMVAHFFHPPSGWNQFGYLAFEPVQGYEAPQGEDA